jgi:hypothetical protein
LIHKSIFFHLKKNIKIKMIFIYYLMLVVVVEDPTDSFEDTEGSLGVILLFGYIRPEVGKASFKEAGAPV